MKKWLHDLKRAFSKEKAQMSKNAQGNGQYPWTQRKCK
jgi:hypothetical protein